LINKEFLSEIVNEINKQVYNEFRLNETSGYFSILNRTVKKCKNIVCFVKDEDVISISLYANIERSILDNPPYNKLKKRDTPPKGLQLRKPNWYLYPHNYEYDLNEDKDLIFKLSKKACKNF